MFNKNINIQNKIINEKNVFIIAEIGSNHNGSLERAKKLINLAKKSGADAVKFQHLIFEDLCFKELKNRKFKKIYDRATIKESWIGELKKYCDDLNIVFFFAATSFKSLELIFKHKIKLIKIASPQFYGNKWLLNEALKMNLPTIVSTGMSSFNEIEERFYLIKKTRNKKVMLLYCDSFYPLKVEYLNFELIKKFKNTFKCLVGFSDHTTSTLAPSLAVTHGANIIEKHFTFDRRLKGPDHFFSLNVEEFSKMTKCLRETEKILFYKGKRLLNKKYRDIFRLKCISDKPYKPNEKLKNITYYAKRASGGIDAEKFDVVQKKYVAKSNIPKDKVINKTDLKRIK